MAAMADGRGDARGDVRANRSGGSGAWTCLRRAIQFGSPSAVVLVAAAMARTAGRRDLHDALRGEPSLRTVMRTLEALGYRLDVDRAADGADPASEAAPRTRECPRECPPERPRRAS